MKNILIRTVILNICVLSLSVSGSVWAVEVGPSATVTGTTPEIRLVDTTTGDASWEIEAQAATSAGANFLEISLDGSTNGSGIFKIHRNADADNFTIDENGNIAINGDAAQVFNELEVFGNVASDTFTAIAMTPDSSSNLSARIRVSNSQNEFGINTRGPSGGYSTPFTIDLGAPSDSLTISAFGDIGSGTAVPTAPLHVLRSDDSAKILVEETNAVQGPRTLFEIKNKGNPEFRMTNTGNSNSWLFSAGQRFVVKNNAGDWVSRITDTGDMEITGELTTSGSICGLGGCDLVFHPDTKIESIEEHAAQMWANSHLPSVGPTQENVPINLSRKTGGILNELEKAHIYIERLHTRNLSLEQRVIELEQQNQRIEELVMQMVRGQAEPIAMK